MVFANNYCTYCFTHGETICQFNSFKFSLKIGWALCRIRTFRLLLLLRVIKYCDFMAVDRQMPGDPYRSIALAVPSIHYYFIGFSVLSTIFHRWIAAWNIRKIKCNNRVIVVAVCVNVCLVFVVNALIFACRNCSLFICSPLFRLFFSFSIWLVESLVNQSHDVIA